MAKAAGGGPDKPSGKGAAARNTSRGAAPAKKPALGKAASNDNVDAALVEEGPPNWKNAWPFFVAAGIFLREFVPDGVRWAHIDMAGPAFNKEAPHGYTPKGGTGVITRTLVALAERHQSAREA